MLVCVFIDPFIGKIDKASLSQQTLMELFIGGLTKTKKRICGYSETPKDIGKWDATTFDDFGEIIRIFWINFFLAGSIELQWLPLSMQDVNLSGNQLTGTVDLTCLPDSLRSLALSRNMFSGTVNLTSLPPNLKRLYINENSFDGKADFSQLPKSLTELNVSHTDIEGEIGEFEGYLAAAWSLVRKK